MTPRTICALLLLCAAPAAAQTKPLDTNVYPALTGPTGLYDLTITPGQKAPPNTIAVTSAAPPPAYSFHDIIQNTHGYLATGISSGSGHNFEGGVSIPLVPGKAELQLSGATGQLPILKFAGLGKTQPLTYDAYNVGLSLHPTENIEAYIGWQGLRLHSNGSGLFGSP